MIGIPAQALSGRTWRMSGPKIQVDEILAYLPDGFVSVDNEWRILCANKAVAALARRSADAIIGSSLFDSLSFHPEAHVQAACAAAKSDGSALALTAEGSEPDTWIELRANPIPVGPHAGGYVILVRDVSEHRRTVRMEIADDAINARLFETSLDLILIVDRTGNFIRISPSSLPVLGYRPDELVGHSAAEFLYAPDLENTRNEMRLARRGKSVRNFECRYHHKDGRIVTIAWTGVWSEPVQQHFFIGRDMTDRIAAEERLRRSQRLESVGQLTGGIAHDFNNLLAVVIGNLDLLQERVEADKEAVELIEAALKASLRGAELTNQLLAFARRQSLDAKLLDINERVVATMGLLRRTLGERVEIATTLFADLWPAYADPTQFESALINLAINARDAMPDGGRLTIETSNASLDERYAGENMEVTPGEYVALAVTDTGTGMAPEVLARVFEPFFTTKPTGKGTGLGLSMVYGFARQSHGHVKIYSELGHGTTVRLYLPRGAGTAAEPLEAAPTALPAAKPGERILLVEDNPDVRKVATAQLAELVYRVVEAASAEAALEMLRSGEPVDLLFSDVVMPGMTGDQLARAARGLRPGFKVLLTSGFAKSSMQQGKRTEEFRNLLSKPYRKAELAMKLRSVLDEGA
jgi:PAS domain S-box-containing protein